VESQRSRLARCPGCPLTPSAIGVQGRKFRLAFGAEGSVKGSVNGSIEGSVAGPV